MIEAVVGQVLQALLGVLPRRMEVILWMIVGVVVLRLLGRRAA